MKTIEKEFNAITGKTTITERDLTDAEIADRELKNVEAADKAAAKALVDAAKAVAQAKLAALGLTTDDLKALGL